MIAFATRRPVAVGALLLAAAVLGFPAWRSIPLELLPEAELPRLHVRALWPGASPETTEAFLTAPLEAAAQQVRGVARVESVSSDENGVGTALVRVEFISGTEMDFARLELSERLAALESQLPAGSRRPWIEAYVPAEFAEQQGPFLAYTLSGPLTPEALRNLVEEGIAPDVRQVDGVAGVLVRGGRERLLEVELDRDRARSLGLDAEAVRKAIASLESAREAGEVDVAGVRRSVSSRERLDSIAELIAAPVITPGKPLVRVGDFARVNDTYEEARAHFRIDGQPAIGFEVQRRSGTNTVAVADRVKQRIATVEAALPPGVMLLLERDESAAIRSQLGEMRNRALVAAVVVLAVLLGFLGSASATLILLAAIGVSLLVTVNLLHAAGATLNLLTLMGLAMGFGLVVDNAIVVLENVFRRIGEGERAAAAAATGAREVLFPVLASTATSVVVLVPFVYLQGESRAFYLPLATAVALSLLASLAVAFTLIPAAAAQLRLRPRRRSLPVARRLADAYARTLDFALRRPWLAAASAVFLLLLSSVLFLREVPRGLVWRAWWRGESFISIEILQPRRDELAHTDAIARSFEQRLDGRSEIGRFVTVVTPRYGNIRVSFPDSLQSTSVPATIKEWLSIHALRFGGAQVRVAGYGPSFYGGSAVPPTFSLQVLGYDYETVRSIAQDVGRRLARFGRVRDVDTNAAGSWFDAEQHTELLVRPDRTRLAAHGLTVEDLARAVTTAVQGRFDAGRARLGGEEVALAVKLAGHHDLEVRDLLDVPVTGAVAAAAPLRRVASLEERDVLGLIRRRDQQYERTVRFEFGGPTALGERVRDAVARGTHLPLGYTLDPDSEGDWSSKDGREILLLVLVALALVFALTAALFESFRQPVCVLLTVPMALIGVFSIFLFSGASFTREAYVGVVMMSGIVVNNAILLVDRINGLRAAGQPLLESIRSGALNRLRPVLMTSATTILALLPMVLLGGDPDANIWNALGWVLIGGLSSSTVLVLTVTPALYLLLERPRRRSHTVAARPPQI